MFPFSQFRALSAKLSVINAKVDKIMTALDDLKGAVQSVADGAAEAQNELQADAAQIKQLTDQLAALPAKGSGTSDADIQSVVSQLKTIADGLPKKVQPVVQAAQSATTAASTASTGS